MSKIKEKALQEVYVKQAKSSTWDDLAFSIICLEEEEKKSKGVKHLKLLRKKLKIFEAEKSSRVFTSFSMDYFLNKDYEQLTPIDDG